MSIFAVLILSWYWHLLFFVPQLCESPCGVRAWVSEFTQLSETNESAQPQPSRPQHQQILSRVSRSARQINQNMSSCFSALFLPFIERCSVILISYSFFPSRKSYCAFEQLNQMCDLLLVCGALCRREDRVSARGAEEDQQCRSQDPHIPAVSDWAEEAGANGRSQKHLRLQTDHTCLTVAWIPNTLRDREVKPGLLKICTSIHKAGPLTFIFSFSLHCK